jgi:hypothetical protein
MIATLVLFPSVTRLAQIGVPQNAASFSGVHRSGIVPASPQLAAPASTHCLLPPETVAHPADLLDSSDTPTLSAVLDTSGLRAPPAVRS